MDLHRFIRSKIQEKSGELNLRTEQIELLLAQERFMARLMLCADGDRFVWKGGSLILRLYQNLPKPRYTLDIDLLVRSLDIGMVGGVFNQATLIHLEDTFEFHSIKKELMKRETPYGGSRYSINWRLLGKPRSQPLRIDVCAGDFVNSQLIESNKIFLLKDLDPSKALLKVYPPDFIIAEKLHTIARYGTGNTRVKDFIDIWQLRKENIPVERLRASVEKCFQVRNLEFNLSEILEILTDSDFIDVLQSASQRHYQMLEIPEMKILVADIAQYCEDIFDSKR